MEHFNQIWEKDIYGKNQHLNRYPFDNVVTFIFRNFPRDKSRNDVHILELGCGAGNNLWFAAREGFSITGIDGSASAIEYAKKRFQEEKLAGNFVVGDFTKLPFDNESFDLIIDRGSLVCTNLHGCKKAIQEAYRVTKKKGRFFLNLYSDTHSSHISGRVDKDGFTQDIKEGALVGVGSLCFHNRSTLREVIGNDWKVLSMKHKEIVDVLQAQQSLHSEWEIILEKE